jgi:2',3'-cyclic-nucleotide 2'-phosphodiesterase (5'-nucleotidase family)
VPHLRSVKLKKHRAAVKVFVLFLTFAAAVSCASHAHVSRIEGKEIPVAGEAAKPQVEAFVRPYRDSIEKDLSTILAYSPENLDKSKGQWQTNIGNMMADAALDFANRILEKREGKTADMCLLNFGGIRAVIPKGDVTTRNAFEVMPFENSLVAAELRGEQIMEMITYIIKEKKAHPVSGLAFAIAKDDTPKNIHIGGKPFDTGESYLVVTSDYLIAGGDNMDFFKKAVKLYDTDYKLRNVLIDYFKEADTIAVRNDVRISQE